DGSAREIIELLLAEMRAAGVELRLSSPVTAIDKRDDGLRLSLDAGPVDCAALVVATGGKSIPKMGATAFGYEVARQFGLALTEIRPALVPLTIETGALERLSTLAGVAVDAVVACGKTRFTEAMLFTHRGQSGPAILQLSSSCC